MTLLQAQRVFQRRKRILTPPYPQSSPQQSMASSSETFIPCAPKPLSRSAHYGYPRAHRPACGHPCRTPSTSSPRIALRLWPKFVIRCAPDGAQVASESEFPGGLLFSGRLCISDQFQCLTQQTGHVPDHRRPAPAHGRRSGTPACRSVSHRTSQNSVTSASRLRRFSPPPTGYRHPLHHH